SVLSEEIHIVPSQLSASILHHPLTSSRVFFFQAEDGIRDATVTGVQTCALPILAQGLRVRCHLEDLTRADVYGFVVPLAQRLMRSEERRVGKEWRCRWSRCR